MVDHRLRRGSQSLQGSRQNPKVPTPRDTKARRRSSRESTGSASRGLRPKLIRPVVLTPVASTQATPIHSALPSTCNTDQESDEEDSAAVDDSYDETENLSIAALTLDVPLTPLKVERRVKPKKPFPFLDLPSELRLKIYDHFFAGTDSVIDLGPDNYKRIHKSLGLMRVCKQIHNEATHFFYSTRCFRVFPTYPGRHFKSKKPLLARLKLLQRQCINSLELRLGPGWNAPPRGWAVNEALGLQDCRNVRRLRVFVEFDPSDNFFRGFRRSEGFYQGFSRKLLMDVVRTMPAVTTIEFDAWSSVRKSGGMMRTLLQTAAELNVDICWGPENGWTDGVEDEPVVADPLQGVQLPGYESHILITA